MCFFLQRDRIRKELAKRGLKKGGSKEDMLKLLKRVWPLGDEDKRVFKCIVCKDQVEPPPREPIRLIIKKQAGAG